MERRNFFKACAAALLGITLPQNEAKAADECEYIEVTPAMVYDEYSGMFKQVSEKRVFYINVPTEQAEKIIAILKKNIKERKV